MRVFPFENERLGAQQRIGDLIEAGRAEHILPLGEVAVENGQRRLGLRPIDGDILHIDHAFVARLDEAKLFPLQRLACDERKFVSFQAATCSSGDDWLPTNHDQE